MHVYVVEELAWVAARERAEEARQTRTHTDDRPEIGPTVTSITVFPASR